MSFRGQCAHRSWESNVLPQIATPVCGLVRNDERRDEPGFLMGEPHPAFGHLPLLRKGKAGSLHSAKHTGAKVQLRAEPALFTGIPHCRALLPSPSEEGEGGPLAVDEVFCACRRKIMTFEQNQRFLTGDLIRPSATFPRGEGKERIRNRGSISSASEPSATFPEGKAGAASAKHKV